MIDRKLLFSDSDDDTEARAHAKELERRDKFKQ